MNPIARLEETLPTDVARWIHAAEGDLSRAWRNCPRPDWLVQIALAVRVDRSLVVHAALEVATDAVARHPISDLRPRRALMTALQWVGGRVPGTQCWAHGFAATEVAETLEGPAADAAYAAAFVAFACDDQADDSFYAHRAYAALAMTHAATTLELSRACQTIRERIPLPVVLERFEVASRPPPPLPLGLDPAEISDSFYC
ncbi:MAG: hypothetical protein SangKO_077240 [Sandaracinaceae bacterium]